MKTAFLAALVLFPISASGCTDDSAGKFNSSTGSGGTANTSAIASSGGSTTDAGGTVNASGGAVASATGGTTPNSTSNTGGTPSVVTTTPARCTEPTSGEVAMTHKSSSGQPNALVGTTTITAGTLSSFNASDLELKFCFSVVGSVTLTSTAGMTIDFASISGGTVNYVNLTGTTLRLETTAEANRYCIVFDVGTAAGASGVSVSGAAAVTYNWRFNEKSVDLGLMFDPRAKNAPELNAVLNSNLAACVVVTS